MRAEPITSKRGAPGQSPRGYFVYVPPRISEIPAIAVFRNWLVAAGSLTETEYPHYLSSKPVLADPRGQGPNTWSYLSHRDRADQARPPVRDADKLSRGVFAKSCSNSITCRSSGTTPG